MTHASSPGEGTPATAPAAGSGSAASGPTAGSRSATSAPAARTGWAAAYPAEAADPHCLAEGEGAELLRGAPWRRFAVVGDSLAEGLGDPQRGYRTGSWADRTAEALLTAAPDAVHTNLGMRGLTTAQVRERQADRAAAFAPDLVAVVCGGNDLLLPGFSPAVVAREMDLLFGRLAAPGRRCSPSRWRTWPRRCPNCAAGRWRRASPGSMASSADPPSATGRCWSRCTTTPRSATATSTARTSCTPPPAGTRSSPRPRYGR